MENKCRGLSKTTMTFVYGYYYEEAAPLNCIGPKEESKGFIIFVNPNILSDWEMPRDMVREEIHKNTLGRCTGCADINGNELYQNDIFESTLNKALMIIRYGEYKAYCSVDKKYMKNVGFYVEADGYPAMPLGATDKYAKLIGNIHENSDKIR